MPLWSVCNELTSSYIPLWSTITNERLLGLIFLNQIQSSKHMCRTTPHKLTIFAIASHLLHLHMQLQTNMLKYKQVWANKCPIHFDVYSVPLFCTRALVCRFVVGNSICPCPPGSRQLRFDPCFGFLSAGGVVWWLLPLSPCEFELAFRPNAHLITERSFVLCVVAIYRVTIYRTKITSWWANSLNGTCTWQWGIAVTDIDVLSVQPLSV